MYLATFLLASIPLVLSLFSRYSVLVLKKLGSDLFEEMIEVINYLGKVEGMRIIVEPQEYEALVSYALLAEYVLMAVSTAVGMSQVHLKS